MPHEITLVSLPIGICTETQRGGDQIMVRSREFLSSEDGQEFIRRLEAVTGAYLDRLPHSALVRPSQVDHLLAIIRRDRTATVYVNELTPSINTRVGRRIERGEPVAKDDIVDICELDLEVPIPPDTGIVFVFSVGWRKGLFYDFSPLTDGSLRDFEPRHAFGYFYSRVLFQERFSISETEWDGLLAAKWFPFAGLTNGTIEKMLAHLRSGRNLDELTDLIVADMKTRLPGFLSSWNNHPAFTSHLLILERATERFLDGDYISCTSLLFPRIEGLLRTYHASMGSTDSAKQANLCASAVQANANRAGCLLLPKMFERYLSQVYFAAFDPKDVDIEVSRNSVSHGTASQAAFNAKAAVTGLLVTHQLFLSFEAPTPVARLAVQR
jgi:hypothetical protein